MSATRSVRRPSSDSARAGRPNSFTSVAPGAENRSVICVVIAALWSAPRGRAARAASPYAAPARSINSVRRVICPQSVHHAKGEDERDGGAHDTGQLKARCAPMTSLFSR